MRLSSKRKPRAPALKPPAIRLWWESREEPPPLPVAVIGEVRALGTGSEAPPHLGESWRNCIIHGDNRLAMSLLASGPLAAPLAACGGVRLIYIDPPFAMDADFRMEGGGVSGEPEKRRRGEQVKRGRGDAAGLAFSDSWSSDGAYVQYMYERLVPMRDLLADDGIIAVHCDWRANSWLRILMDEVFGRDCFRNEVIWRRAPNLGNQAAAKQLGRVVDTILIYSKTPGSIFRGTPPMRSQPVELTTSGRPRGAKWDQVRQEWFTTAPRGDYTDASIKELRRLGRVHETASGKLYIKYPLRQGADGLWYKDQPVDTLWTDDAVKPLRHCTREELDIGYPTQKPLGLLRRLIEWTTREGDLVADFFCGSGTTLAAAHGLGRKWVGCDIGERAVQVAAKRLGDPGAGGVLLLVNAGTPTHQHTST